MTTLRFQVPQAPKRVWPWVAAALICITLAATIVILVKTSGETGARKTSGTSVDAGVARGAGTETAVTPSAPAAPAAAAWVPAGVRPLDLHADTPYQYVKKGPFTLDKRVKRLDMDVPRLKEARYLGQYWVVWVPPGERDHAKFAERSWAGIEAMLDGSGGALEIATTPEEIRKLDAAGKIAIVPCMEGAHPLGSEPEKLKAWAARGVRYLGITWNNSNAFGDAAQDSEQPNGGLSPKGHRLVRLAEELGVALDVSHAATTTFWDIYLTGSMPFVASHSNARSLRDHPRNLDDLQLWALAEAGGVVGVNYHSAFLSDQRATIAVVANHVVHLARVMGKPHVALGSDFDGMIAKPTGLGDVTKVSALFAELEKRGWTADELAQLASGNALRVLGDVVGKKKRPSAPVLAPVDALDVSADAAPGHAALFAADRNVLTAWQPPLDQPREQLILAVPAIADIGGLVIVGHDETGTGARVQHIEVSLHDKAGLELGRTRRLKLANDPRPQAVSWPAPEPPLPAGAGSVRITIIDGFPGQTGPLGLAEVAPMRRAGGG